MTTLIAHNIGDVVYNGNYNTPDQIKALSPDITLTFDGIYRNVYGHRELLRRFKRVILFVMGGYVGGNNSFDWYAHEKAGVKLIMENYCTWNELMDMSLMGCEIGWHTWTHPDLTKLTQPQLMFELTPPFPMNTIAYPFGFFDDRVLNAAKSLGFKQGYSVRRGDNTPFQLTRKFITELPK